VTQAIREGTVLARVGLALGPRARSILAQEGKFAQHHGRCANCRK
jgi:hypothetical protein